MSTATNIVVNDGATTPVAHTFYPVQNSGGDGFTFYDSITGIPVYENKIWGKLKMGTPSTASESTLGIICPVTQTVSGIVSQNHVNTARAEFKFAPNATAAERADCYAFLINALNNALVKEQTRDLKAWY